MWIAKVKDGRCAAMIRVTGLVGMKRAVAPEQIKVAGNELKLLWTQKVVPDGCANQFPTQRVLQQRFFENIDQHVGAYAATIGEQQQITPVDAILRNFYR